MKTVVVPLDVSDAPTNALSLVATLAHVLDARVELVHVQARVWVPATRDVNPIEAELFLAETRSALAADIDVRTTVVCGDPVERVLELVRHNSDSLLVVPSRGRAGLSRAVFGSVSDQIVRLSPVPVVVTREDMRLPRHSLSSILVPLDSSPLSERALPWAMSLARKTDARVTLVSVIDVNQVAAYAGIDRQPDLLAGLEDEARDLAREYLDEVVRRVRSQGIRATWEVRLGRPSDEIIRIAETTAADLVVMSTHGRGGIRRWAFGSITDDVLQRGSTPVMIIPS